MGSVLIFFLRGVALQARDAVARIRRIQELREQSRGKLQTARAMARLLQVVDLLFARPVLTVRQAQATLEVDFPAAQWYVQQLAHAGFLREVTGKARNRVYRADEVLRAIEEPLHLGNNLHPGEAR